MWLLHSTCSNLIYACPTPFLPLCVLHRCPTSSMLGQQCLCDIACHQSGCTLHPCMLSQRLPPKSGPLLWKQSPFRPMSSACCLRRKFRRGKVRHLFSELAQCIFTCAEWVLTIGYVVQLHDRALCIAARIPTCSYHDRCCALR